MLVEINLLPKKEPKNYSFLAILLIAVFVFLVIGSYFFFTGSSYQTSMNSLDQQIATVNKLVDAESSKQGKTQTTSSISQLQAAIDWASEEPLKTVPVIKHITELLPQRGFIQSISYSEVGMVSVAVQFDTSRDAAFFLKTLLDSQWFEEVKLNSLTTSESETKEKEVAEETNKEDSNSTEESNSETNGDANSAAETEKKDEETTSTEEAKKEADQKDEHIVPRYIGQYQLTLNRKFINKIEKESSQTGGDN